MKPSPQTVARYGQPGDVIPGSVYQRDYCAVCGEPIRVHERARLGLNECQDCKGLIPAKVLSQRRALRCDYGPPAVGGRRR